MSEYGPYGNHESSNNEGSSQKNQDLSKHPHFDHLGVVSEEWCPQESTPPEDVEDPPPSGAD